MMLVTIETKTGAYFRFENVSSFDQNEEFFTVTCKRESGNIYDVHIVAVATIARLSQYNIVG